MGGEGSVDGAAVAGVGGVDVALGGADVAVAGQGADDVDVGALFG